MPTYQYRCQHCGHEFEVFQSIIDDPVSICPKCGNAPRRIITGGAGFLLKGSGFYATDYRSAAYKKAAQADSTPTPSETKSNSDSKAKSSSDTAKP